MVSYVDIDSELLFELKENIRSRGHNYAIKKTYCGKAPRYNFFSKRVVNDWNKLLASVVNATSIIDFKHKLEETIYHCIRGSYTQA